MENLVDGNPKTFPEWLFYQDQTEAFHKGLEILDLFRLMHFCDYSEKKSLFSSISPFTIKTFDHLKLIVQK